MSLVSTLVNDTRDLLSAFATLLTKKNNAAQFFDLMELPEQTDAGKDCGTFVSIEAKNLKYRYPLTEKYVLERRGTRPRAVQHLYRRGQRVSGGHIKKAGRGGRKQSVGLFRF
jgi:hypothetical protein